MKPKLTLNWYKCLYESKNVTKTIFTEKKVWYMKKAIYWVMGERAGRTIVGTWNWLWGMPVESGGKVAVAVAE